MSKYKYEGYGVIRDTEIDFPYHTDDIVELLDEKDQNIADLEAKLTESEKQLQDMERSKLAWENKYFKLEEKLKSITEEIYENFVDGQKYNELKQQLKNQPAEIVEKIKEQLIKRLNIIAGYGKMTTDELSFFIETEFGSDLDTILKEYQK